MMLKLMLKVMVLECVDYLYCQGCRAKYFFERVQDAGANIAIDHANGANGQGGE